MSNSMVDKSKHRMGNQKTGRAPRPIAPRLNSALRLNPIDTQCIGFAMFEEDIAGWFAIDDAVKHAWIEITKKAMSSYKQLSQLVNRNRLPHVAAYESAIVKVYREEIKKAEKSKLQRDPGPSALLSAKRRVGALFPRGEARLRIEALFETIKIRLKLVPASQAFSDYFLSTLKPCISKSGKTSDKDVIADNFQYLTWGLLRGCRRDIDLAVIFCIQAEGRRLELTACILSLQVEYAFTRFLAQDMTAGWRLPDEQTILQAKHESLLHRVWAASQDLALYDRVGSIMANSPATLAWAKNVVLPVINQTLNEWSTFVNELKLSAFYQHVSVEEKMSIVEAVLAEHGSGGRFYQVSAFFCRLDGQSY